MALTSPVKDRSASFWFELIENINYCTAIELFTAGTTVVQAIVLLTTQQDAN